MDKKILLILVVTLTVVGVYFYFAKYIKPQENEANKAYEIKFEMMKLYEDEVDGGIVYPKLISGVDPKVITFINNDIENDLRNSCFGLPNDNSSLEQMRNVYQSATGEPQEGLSYEDMRSRLKSEYDYSSFVVTSVDYAKNDLLSISYTIGGYCGGAHPYNNSFARNYNLKNGNIIKNSDILDDTNKELIELILKFADKEKVKGEPECNYLEDYKRGVINLEDIIFSISENGLKLQSFGYPYASQFCEPSGQITVPFEILAKYFKEGSILGKIFK